MVHFSVLCFYGPTLKVIICEKSVKFRQVNRKTTAIAFSEQIMGHSPSYTRSPRPLIEIQVNTKVAKLTLFKTCDIRAAWIIHFSSKLIFKYQTKEMRYCLFSRATFKDHFEQWVRWKSTTIFPSLSHPNEFLPVNLFLSALNSVKKIGIEERDKFCSAYIRFTFSLIDIQLLFDFDLEWISNKMLVGHNALKGLKFTLEKTELKSAAFVNKRDFQKLGYLVTTCAVCMLNRLVLNYFYLWTWRRQHKHFSTYCDWLNKSLSNRNQNTMHHKKEYAQ